MSTKNLARTAIEGGRYKRTKEEAQTEQRKERAASRSFVTKATHDLESIENKPTPKRKPRRLDQKDKLRPLERFLLSNIGRPWRLVYAEIRKRFDDRTTAGRHILFDHMLRDIKGAGSRSEYYGGRYCPFLIDGTVSGPVNRDEHGNLRYWFEQITKSVLEQENFGTSNHCDWCLKHYGRDGSRRAERYG